MTIGGVVVDYPLIGFELEVKADEIAPNVIMLGLKVRSLLDKPPFSGSFFPSFSG